MYSYSLALIRCLSLTVILALSLLTGPSAHSSEEQRRRYGQ